MPALFLEAGMLALSCAADAFIVSFSYGTKKIKIPVLSAVVINAICAAVFGGALFAGTALRQYVPAETASVFSFCVFLLLGLLKLLDGAAKEVIKKFGAIKKRMKFSLFSFKFILNVYADPEKADADESKTISPAEAVSLSAALSVDGIAAGFAASLGNANSFIVFFSALAANMLAIIFGAIAGENLAHRIPINFSWLSGAIFIALAISKIC
ncbi:MAG: sporulation membrane protein YtaF [Oscillospiraceae bacterium]|nr:sporulation membrane protein YtaF [Oscillospiraceae bacterium]